LPEEFKIYKWCDDFHKHSISDGCERNDATNWFQVHSSNGKSPTSTRNNLINDIYKHTQIGEKCMDGEI
jgi:hypothetical protein